MGAVSASLTAKGFASAYLLLKSMGNTKVPYLQPPTPKP